MNLLLKYTINQTIIILVVFLLLFLVYFPALNGPGLTSIAQILCGLLIGVIGILNYLLTGKGLFLRNWLLFTFAACSFLILMPFLVDNILPKLDDYVFSLVSLVGIFLSALIFLTVLFIIWKTYLRNK